MNGKNQKRNIIGLQVQGIDKLIKRLYITSYDRAR